MSDWDTELESFIKDAARDIIHDHVTYDRPVKPEIKSWTLDTSGYCEDDGVAFCDFTITVNGGQYIIKGNASGVFKSWRDCWDNASESHYTSDVYFDELQDCEYEITGFTEDTGQALDKVVDSEVDSRGTI